MIPKEILKKVRKIEIQTRSIVNEVLSGEYQSVFKGRGMEFSEVREYFYGDDIRNIDWNVTARMGKPFVKVFEEERELTVMLMVDVSSSSDFGTVQQMKGEIAVEICALLAFSAINNNDKVGLILFTDEIEKFIPPKKGRQHVLRVIRELLYFKPKGKSTNLNNALEYLSKVIRKKSVVFTISDFIAEDYDKALRIASKKHDVVAITMTDPKEIELPVAGFIELEDAETGETILVDTTDAEIRNLFNVKSLDEREKRAKMFKSMNVDFIDITTDRSYMEPLIKFFKLRAKRLRH